MKFHLMAVVVLCFAAIHSTRSLSCPCWRAPRNCTELTSEDCPFGVTTDACGCCPSCVNGPGEECGGPWRVYGPCPEGYECVRNPDPAPEGPREICQEAEDVVYIDSIREELPLYPQ